MQSLEENNAEDFSELICPECGRRSIREYEPLSEEYNTKRKKLLNASRCQNESCPKGRLSADEVKIQLKTSGSLGAALYFVKNNALTVIGSIVGLIVILFVLQTLLFGGGGSVSVSGTITTQTGEPIQNATVYIGSEQVKTNENGKYSISVSPGNYTLYVKPPTPSPYGFSPETNITVTQNGTLSLQENVSTLSKTNNGLSVSLQNITTYTTTQDTSNKNIPVNINNPKNLDLNTNPKIIFDGTNSNQGEIQLESGMDITQKINADTLTQETINLKAPKTQTTITHPITDGKPYNIEDETIENPRIKLNGSKKRVEQTFTGGGSKSITVSGTEPATVNATVIGQGEISTETREGVYTDQDPTITLNETQTVTVNASGSKETTTETIQKTTSQSGTFQIEGEQPVTDVSISIPESSPDGETTEVTASADGEGGTETTQKKLLTADQTGEYTVSVNTDVTRNGDLVSAGYKIGENGEQKELTGETTISLEAGETVYVWITATNDETKQENTGQNKFNGDGSETAEIIDYSVSSKTIDPGERVTVTATLENTGDSRSAVKTVLWKNGRKVLERQLYIDGGETEQVELASVKFQETGSVGVNGLDPTIVKVNKESESGSGTVTATATKKEQTTGAIDIQISDGTTCSIQLSGGTCSIGTLDPQSYTVEMQSDNQTLPEKQYTINYKRTTQPRDVSIDIDNDGTPEKSHTGTLSGTITATKELKQGTHTINLENGNNAPVDYTISWKKTTGSINEFSAMMDGETVIPNQQIQGSKTIQLKNTSIGGHDLTFNSQQGQYKVILTWNEYNLDDLPAISVDGSSVCTTEEDYSSNYTCSLSNSAVSSGPHTITTENDNANAVLSYEKISIASQATVTVNGHTQVFEKIDARTIYDNGTWETSVATTHLKTGDNDFSMTSQDGNAFATVEYTAPNTGAKKPKAIITTQTGNSKIIKVPDSKLQQDGIFTTTYTRRLKPQWFAKGENEVIIRTDTPITVQATVTFSSTASQSKEFNKK